MVYGYIYYLKNEINGKMYLGKVTSRTLFSKPNYKGSGIDLGRAIEEFGKENFSIHFLSEASCGEELTQLEKYYLNYYKIPNEKFYNMNLATSGGEQTDYFNANNQAGVNLKDIVCYNIKSGETMIFNNITQFCKDHCFSRGCVFNVMSGQRVSHKDCIFWYADYPISDDALNWIINYKLKTNYQTKYIKINEVKDELNDLYQTAQNKKQSFNFHGYYIEDGKEIAIDWDSIKNTENLKEREGKAPLPERRSEKISLNTTIDKKFENSNRSHDYILESDEHTLYFNYDEISTMTKIYTDISDRLLRQAIRRGQQTVMKRKYKLITISAHEE